MKPKYNSRRKQAPLGSASTLRFHFSLAVLMVSCFCLPSLSQTGSQTPPAASLPAASSATPTQSQTAPAVPNTSVAPVIQTQSQDSSPTSGTGASPAILPPSQPSSAGNPPSTDAPQAPSDQDNGIFVFKKRVEEVVLHATVVDEQRHLVPNLDRNAFTVFESGTRQTITSFHRDDVPVEMGIVIDNSGSMREKRDKVNEAVLNLIHESNPEDEIFVVNFSKDGYLDQDFTSNVNLLRDALHKVSMQGSTALYDAIVASSVHLRNNAHLDNKVLLVITDGRDNASRETLQEARLRLQQKNGPTLYVIGLLGDGLEPKDREVLGTLADSSGGAAFFPRSLAELDDISRTIGHDIRSRYTIGYKSTNPRQDSGYRPIQVAAQSPGYRPLTVRTRAGYYPGESVH